MYSAIGLYSVETEYINMICDMMLEDKGYESLHRPEREGFSMSPSILAHA